MTDDGGGHGLGGPSSVALCRQLQTCTRRPPIPAGTDALAASACNRRLRRPPLVGKSRGERASISVSPRPSGRRPAEGAETLNWVGIGSFPISFRTFRSLVREGAWMMLDVPIRGIPRRRQTWFAVGRLPAG